MDWWGWGLFPPRWQCGSGWGDYPWIGWALIVADIATAVGYAAIPLAIEVWLRRASHSVAFRRTARLFQAFVGWCGLRHLVDALVFWVPMYPILALVSAGTAVATWRTIAHLLRHSSSLLALKVELETESRLFSTAYDSGVVAICFVDPNEGRFLAANSAACEFFERTEKELKLLTFDQITHPDEKALDWSAWTEVRAGRRDRMVVEKRYLMPTPDAAGNARWKWALLIATAVRGRDGRILHSISIIQDIDSLKRANATLERRVAELEQAVLADDPSPSHRTRLDALLEQWRAEDGGQ